MKFTLITVFALVGAAMAAPVIEVRPSTRLQRSDATVADIAFRCVLVQERQASSSAAPSTYEARGAWG